VPPGVEDPRYLKGLENSNKFVDIRRWMLKHGCCDAEIAKVI